MNSREASQENTPLLPYQGMAVRVYVVGFALMVLYNLRCYPGSFVGVFGWAALWPLYIPANLVRVVVALQAGDGLTAAALWGEVCQGAIIGFRAG